MSDPRWSEVEAAFGAALETSPGSREALLASLCSEESTRSEVRRLLARHESLSSPAADIEFMRLDSGRAAALVEEERDPPAIGRYQILGRVGRGATGTVYLAGTRS